MEQQELNRLIFLAEQNDSDALKSLGNYYTNEVQDYDKAFELYIKSAELGNVKAMYNLGLKYELGQGCAKDSHKAYEWYLKSAKGGFKKANLRIDAIGGNLEFGANGFAMNKEKAAQCYKIAAENGCSWGQCHFGNCLLTGTGIEKNESEAFKWLKEATENKDEICVMAYGNLGYCYEYGTGTDVDLSKAAYCYLKYRMNNLSDHWAYTRFNATIKYLENKNLSKEEIIFVANSVTYITNCSPESINDTLKWIIPAAELGDSSALDQLGMAYERGLGVDVDAEKAEYYLCEAAKLDNVVAIDYLAKWFYGIGTLKEKNPAKAVLWLEKLYELNNDKAAASKLFYHYFNGDGIEKSLENAFKWAERADFDIGFRRDGELSFLGDCFESGIGTDVDHMKAMNYYQQALDADSSYEIHVEKDEIRRKLDFVKKEILAEGGSPIFQKELAQELKERNPQQSDYWTAKAADNGDADSCYVLAEKYFFEKDEYEKALEYCQKAAELGRQEAQILLPIIQNFVKACQGDANAQCHVGAYYEEGNDFIDKDLDEAESWYKKAMLNGNQNAAVLLNGVQMKQSNIENEAQRKAMEEMKREMEEMREESERNREAAEKTLADARQKRVETEKIHQQELNKIREEVEKAQRDREAAEREREKAEKERQEAASELKRSLQERDAKQGSGSKLLNVRIDYWVIYNQVCEKSFRCKISGDLYNKLMMASEYEVMRFLNNNGESIGEDDYFHLTAIYEE